MSTAVKINNLSVTLGGHVKALKNINLELEQGVITGFIGPSGAGKTTLVRAIVSRLQTPDGSVVVLDRPAGDLELLKVVNYMGQERSIYPDITVAQNIYYFARIGGHSKQEAREQIKKILKQVDLPDKRDSLVRNLSGGQKQRASLAIALIGEPELMVLDEPTTGLDPALRNSLWDLFRKIAESGTSLIITSHSMDEATRCDDLVLLQHGKLIAHDSPEHLLKATNTESVEAAFLKLVGAA